FHRILSTHPATTATQPLSLHDALPIYRELQYGLRKAVAARTLDELLGDKATLDAEIFAYVRGRVEELGIEMLGVGVKDVILPGEDRKSTRLNSSHVKISYAVFCLKKKK